MERHKHTLNALKKHLMMQGGENKAKTSQKEKKKKVIGFLVVIQGAND